MLYVNGDSGLLLLQNLAGHSLPTSLLYFRKGANDNTEKQGTPF